MNQQLHKNRLRLQAITLSGQYKPHDKEADGFISSSYSQEKLPRRNYSSFRYPRRAEYESDVVADPAPTSDEEHYTSKLRQKLHILLDSPYNTPTTSRALEEAKLPTIPKADDLIQESKAARQHAFEIREKLKIKQSTDKDAAKTPKQTADSTAGASVRPIDKYPELKLYRGLPKETSEQPEEHKSAFTRVENRKEAIQRRIELMKIMDSNGEILDTLMDPTNRDYNSLYSI